MPEEDLSDLIESETEVDWERVKNELSDFSTLELIDMMKDLGLYVNRKLAMEIAGRKDAVFHLRKLLQDGWNWYDHKDRGCWAPIHSIHLLARIKNKDALCLLLDVLRFRGEDLDEWLCESVPGLLCGFREDAIDTLKTFVEDETLEGFARGTVVAALVNMALKGSERTEEIKEHLLRLLDNTADELFAGELAYNLARFRDDGIATRIYKAYDDDRIDKQLIGRTDVEDIVSGKWKTDEKPDMNDPFEHFSRSNIELLRNIFIKDRKRAEINPKKSEQAQPQQPVKKKKVGVNEPCPCGSGKKYKKCCLKRPRKLEVVGYV